MNESHPALHAPTSHINDDPEDRAILGKHFVPEGWEAVDVGICPCGEAVRWSETTEHWVPDRRLTVFVLSPGEVEVLMAAVDTLSIDRQAPMQPKANALRDCLQLQEALNKEPVCDHPVLSRIEMPAELSWAEPDPARPEGARIVCCTSCGSCPIPADEMDYPNRGFAEMVVDTLNANQTIGKQTDG